jgi:hypothetical protein
MDLYAQELKVWKECVGLREQQGGEESGIGEVELLEGCRVPGAFEWWRFLWLLVFAETHIVGRRAPSSITGHSFTIDNTDDIKQRRKDIKKPHQDDVSEVMQYDYLYQKSMEKIEHKKKGIETCLNGRQGQKKKKTEIRNRQPEDHIASLLR